MADVATAIQFVLWVGIILLLARFVIDWVMLLARSWRPSGFVAVLCEAVFSVTDPPLRAIRRVIPPLRMGGVALDLSPLVLLIALQIAMAVVGSLAR